MRSLVSICYQPGMSRREKIGLGAVCLLFGGLFVQVYHARQRVLSEIWTAARRGELARVEHLLEGGQEVDGRDEHGRTALSFAAQGKHEATVRLLLDRGANPNIADQSGWRPLTYAVGDKPAVVQLLLDRGADLHAKTMHGQSALWIAAGSGGEAIVQLLLDRGADIDGADIDGVTPLMQAIGRQCGKTLEPLIHAGADLNARDKKGRTALSLAIDNANLTDVDVLLRGGARPDLVSWVPSMLAAMKGDRAAVERELEAGQDVNSTTPDARLSPLMLAARFGSASVVAILLNRGARVDDRDAEGRTALMHAAAGDNADVVRLLLNAGADPRAMSGEHTAFVLAALYGSVSAIEVLLDSGLQIDEPAGDGTTALIQASSLGHVDAVRLLLRRGARIDARDEKGATALMHAARGWRPSAELINLLVDHGARVNDRDSDGWSPLHRAAMAGDPETIRSLLDRGADANAFDEAGFTPLMTFFSLNDDSMAGAEVLVGHGADVNIRTNGRTALGFARVLGRRKAAAWLEAHGATELPWEWAANVILDRVRGGSVSYP